MLVLSITVKSFLSTTVYQFNIQMKYLFTFVIFYKYLSSMIASVHKHVNHFQTTKLSAHEVKWFYSRFILTLRYKFFCILNYQNAPFCKISSYAQCGRFSLMLWRLVKRSFFCVFYVRLSTENIILTYWIKIDHIIQCTLINDHNWQLWICPFAL